MVFVFPPSFSGGSKALWMQDFCCVFFFSLSSIQSKHATNFTDLLVFHAMWWICPPQITRNSCVATNPQTEKHPVTFNPEQKLFHNLIQEDERKTGIIFNRKIWLLAFSRKILGKKNIMIRVWFWTYGAQSLNFQWLRFQCYGGPIFAQKFVNSSWLFLQHRSWQASKSKTFCLCSSRLFEARWLTLCNILLFSSHGLPPTWEDWQGMGEGRDGPESPSQFVLQIGGKTNLSTSLLPPTRQDPSLCHFSLGCDISLSMCHLPIPVCLFLDRMGITSVSLAPRAGSDPEKVVRKYVLWWKRE